MATKKRLTIKQENNLLRRENERMRSALIDYYQADIAYEMEPTIQYYGRYQEACRALIVVAKALAEREGRKRSHAV